jgi:L-ascorbate metabolism protein UlaG (beta-lactamase superfamily)
LLAALAVLSFTSAHAVEIQWFGQSAFKITTPGGKVILVDPFITQEPQNTRRPSKT